MAAPSSKTAIFATGDLIVCMVSVESFMVSGYYISHGMPGLDVMIRIR